MRNSERHLRALRPLLALGAACWALAEGHAQAQEGHRSYRTDGPRRGESPQHFAVEFRFGPYRPEVDKALPNSRPYDTVFGGDHRVLVGLEVDWQMLRIPSVGTLGGGLGWSYTQMSANAPFHDVPSQRSAQTTSLTIMPMFAVGVMRVDVLARETVVPLVPYVKGGIGYAAWWIGGDLGVQGKGGTWGAQGALGCMLLLDRFDPHAAIQLDADVGVNHSYIFFEWMRANLNNFGGGSSSMQVGASTWLAGLALEL